MKYLEILCVWGWIHGCFEGLEYRIGEEKSKNPSDRPWGAAPTSEAPNKHCPLGPGPSGQKERLRVASVCEAQELCTSQSANTPVDPVLSLSFCTNS